MRIRNKNLLKWPWLWPVCTTIGAAFVFVQPSNLSTAVKMAIFLGVVVAVNIFFFISLKRTRSQNPPDLER